MTRIKTPETSSEAIVYFANPDVSLQFLTFLRWPGGVACYHCDARDPMFLKTRRIWKCKVCRKQFSVKLGTIFEDSPLGLDKWLPAIWMLANAKNGISSYELARALRVTQKTGWFMLGRIRLAMQTQTFKKMSGSVEADETYVGGLSKFMHKSKRERVIKSRGMTAKVAVMGIMQRGDEKECSTIRTEVVEGIKTKQMHERIHANGLESFWSLLKRTIKGTYVSVDPFRMFRYLDEQTFRFNHRKENDGWRFAHVVSTIMGKRLTYKNLIGQDLAPA